MTSGEQEKAQIEKHVIENQVNTREGRRCVDGRYSPNSSESGTIARPGGDFGYVMALIRVNQEKGLGLSTRECVEKVYDTLTSIGSEKFSMHTDHHASFPKDEKSLPSIDCGHIAKSIARDSNPEYGIDSDDVKEALHFFREKVQGESEIKVSSLEGEHEEKAVLVVTGTKKTVNPSSRDQMYFVYDRTRDENFLRALVERMDIPELTFEDMLQASNKQLDATLKILAKGLPIFQVNVDKEVEVKKIN